MNRFIVLIALFVAIAGTASAQTGNARVVTACGTAPTTYQVGQPVPLLVDINGNLCGANGGSGGTPTSITPAATTPAGPDIATVTTGGVAVNAFSAGHCSKGCILVNPKGATIDLCVNGTGTPASGTTTAGALICIPPGQGWGFTPRATAISAISSDSAHPFGGEGYQ